MIETNDSSKIEGLVRFTEMSRSFQREFLAASTRLADRVLKGDLTRVEGRALMSRYRTLSLLEMSKPETKRFYVFNEDGGPGDTLYHIHPYTASQLIDQVLKPTSMLHT